MDLGGQWAATEADEDLRRSFPKPELDDGTWSPVSVPGHWQAEPAFACSDGPLLYRRRFQMGRLAEGERAWLVMDGVFYQSDVWLDGSYLGDTEGYFFPHSFDVTSAVNSRSDHVLAVEVGCERRARRQSTRALLGAFGSSAGIDPARNPGGIWAPVRVETSGPVRISSLRAICLESGARRAVLDFFAVLDSAGAVTAALRTRVSRVGAASDAPCALVEKRQPLAVGPNRVRWRVEVPSPELWWPVGMGEQVLYDIDVGVEPEGERSDGRALRTGLRQVRMHNFIWSVNGERLFLKGANLLPTRPGLAEALASEVAGDVALARDAGLNLLRAHSHIARPELYEAADRLGVLIWQDMPLQGVFKGGRNQAVRQAAAAVDLLGHHPSIVVWCGHNEPFPAIASRRAGRGLGVPLRWAAGQALPSWNKTVLDHSIRRTLEKADPSRPAVAHSGMLPHPAWGTDVHLYFGWRHGGWRDLPRAAAVWPAAVRFVGELGAQAVPGTAEFMGPERWPDLDWERLAEHHCLQREIFDERFPTARYPTFEAWRDATQAYQARLVAAQVEALRRLRSRPVGGFAVFCLSDAQPAVSSAVLDHERRPKAAYAALRAACAPVLLCAVVEPGP
jgi:beta-mannosidase